MSSRSRAAFKEAIDYFHGQVDERISDHTGTCNHPECDGECSRPSTAQEYWYERRGYRPDTVGEWRLGWAPADGGLYTHLSSCGFSEGEIRSTGLFTDPKSGRPSALWRGRYVFPYFDTDGEPVYAIARTTGNKGGGAAGYDGHPEDFLAGKYAKVAHTKDYVPFEEPIFGLNTLSEGGDVVIAEGIADAITAAEAGHAVLSPVTTQFKQKHFDELLAAVEEHDIDRVFVIPDSERAGFSLIDSDDVPESPDNIYEVVNLPKVSPGIGGGLRTAAYLSSNGVDTRVVELPRSGLRKVDLDDYLHEWSTELDSVMASSKPAYAHPDYETATETQDTADETAEVSVETGTSSSSGRDDPLTRTGASALWELDVRDVNSDLQPGYRGKNPLGHVGDSENYFVVYQKAGNGACVGKDYKRPGLPTYTGCTYLLVELGERDVSAPSGELSPKETWEAWAEARRRGLIGDDDIIPTKALRHIAESRGLYDFEDSLADEDDLPLTAHNRALGWVKSRWPEDEDAIDEEEDDITGRHFRKVDSDAAIYSWQDVRYIYEQSKQDGRKAAEDLLSQKYDFMKVAGEDGLRVYNPDTGVFEADVSDIYGEIHDGLQKHWSTHQLNEIEAGLQQETVVQPKMLNGRAHFDDPHICVANGVLNLFTRELHDHSPKYHFTRRIPVAYDPDADTEPYESFLDDLSQRDEDAAAMIEMVGHTLIPDANERYKKFLILTGDADNGKSVFYSRVVDLLEGPDSSENNVASVKLAKLSQNRFSKNSMYGYMANIAGEIDGKKIRNTSDLKDITGGDEQEIEPKGGDSFFDTINTTLMFAANDPPIIGERDKEAIATRIVPVELPFKFVDDPEGPFEKQRRPERELKEELATDEALSGFLNLALGGIERLEDNHGDVSLPENKWERLKRYEKSADPMKEFGDECLENKAGDYVVKADITSIYKAFAASNGYEVGSHIHDTLHGVLQGMQDLNYTTSRPRNPDYVDTSLPLRSWNERKTVIDRVTLNETGLRYAEEAGLVEEDSRSESDTKLFASDIVAAHMADDGRLPTFRAIVSSQWEDRFGNHVGRLSDPDGGVDFTVEGKGRKGIEEGDALRIDNARMRKTETGAVAVVIDPVTDVEHIDEDIMSTDEAAEATAAADGGDVAQDDLVTAIVQHTTAEGEPTRENIASRVVRATGASESHVREQIESLLRDGTLYEPQDGELRVN